MELEKRVNLLGANYVVIENQPSFKNPRMKSIAISLYDYYLIRGIIDKEITKSNIQQVKFMSPSNKLKIASDGDTKEFIGYTCEYCPKCGQRIHPDLTKISKNTDEEEAE
jgi:hypothetical protein